jgi:predicted small lipoprotein YifL
MSHRRRIGFALAVLMLASALAACGKKAGKLDAPGEGEDHFPLTYPDPATDPKPELVQ